MIDEYVKDIIRKTRKYGEFATAISPTAILRWRWSSVFAMVTLQQQVEHTKLYMTEVGGGFKEFKIAEWTKWMDIPYG